MTFLTLWILAGLVALGMSIYCMGWKPSQGNMDLEGLLLAIFLGPLYWIFYFKKAGYCGR